jgi:hypothetical protein
LIFSYIFNYLLPAHLGPRADSRGGDTGFTGWIAWVMLALNNEGK